MLQWILPSTSPDIAKYVECYWFIEKHADSDSYQFPKLNPDPSAHLIISPKNQAYHYDLNPGVASGEGSHWLYPHQQTFQLDHTKPFVHLGIKFRIGALYSADFPNENHVILDVVSILDLAAVMDDSSINESQVIELARSHPEQCCAQLEHWLLPWFINAKEDQHSNLTRKALSVLDSSSISELGGLLFCSQRTLERSFNRVTGLTLKQCQAMNNLEAMLEYLYQREPHDIDWVDVALQFGFSDQPHLIRHLKKQLGLTPGTYAKGRELTIDVYGGVSSN